MENTSYRNSGVDVVAGYRSVELMKPHVERTRIPGMLTGIGGFGGLFAPNLSGMREPVLVSGTDGVGTKLRVAQLLARHDSIGIDAVAMCVNDVVCAGAQPLFFLDYIAIGKNVPELVASIVSGVAEGCVQAGCALIGGETAEHPGTMSIDDYDIAGFTVGVVDKDKILDPSSVRVGDVLLGLASSGVHSNGFSLIRKIFDVESKGFAGYCDELGHSLGEELLIPTRIYVKSILTLLNHVPVRSICHITGGGFFENIPRVLPNGMTAHIHKQGLAIPPVFQLLQKVGEIPERDMYNTFNMGYGMCLVVPADFADAAIRSLQSSGERASVIGEIVSGDDGVILA